MQKKSEYIEKPVLAWNGKRVHIFMVSKDEEEFKYILRVSKRAPACASGKGAKFQACCNDAFISKFYKHAGDHLRSTKATSQLKQDMTVSNHLHASPPALRAEGSAPPRNEQSRGRVPERGGEKGKREREREEKVH